MKLLLVAVLVAVCFESISSSHFDAKSKLWKKLFDDYNKEFEPEGTSVKFGIVFQCAKYNRKHHELHTSVWERYSWVDSRLKWDPADFDNVTKIRVDHTHVWYPDFKLLHGVHAEEDRDFTKAVINFDGTVLWIPTAVYKTHCERNADKSLHCHYKIGSWVVDADTMPLTKWGDGASFVFYQHLTCPLVATIDQIHIDTKVFPCCPEPYSFIDVSVNYKHKKGHHDDDDDDDDDDHHHHHHHHEEKKEEVKAEEKKVEVEHKEEEKKEEVHAPVVVPAPSD